MCVEVPMKETYNNKKFLTFKPLSYVPIQADLCVSAMMDEKEKKWLKEYNQQCYEQMLPRIKDTHVMEWVKEQMEKAARLYGCLSNKTMSQIMPLLHRHIDVQAKHFLLVLIEHLALDAVSTAGRLVVEDGLLNDRHLTGRGRAGQTVDVNLATVQRQANGGVLAKVALLSEHLQTLEVSRKSPSSSSKILVQRAITKHSGVLARDNRVVNDLDRVEDSVSTRTGADLPGNGTGSSHNSLGLTIIE